MVMGAQVFPGLFGVSLVLDEVELVPWDSSDNPSKCGVVPCQPRLCMSESLFVFNGVAEVTDGRNLIEFVVPAVVFSGWTEGGNYGGFGRWSLDVFEEVPFTESVERLGLPFSKVVVGSVV